MYPLLELAVVNVVSPDAVVDSVKDLPVSLDKGLILSSSSSLAVMGSVGLTTSDCFTAGRESREGSDILDFEGRCSSMRDDPELFRFR